jgi:hypothetical protein
VSSVNVSTSTDSARNNDNFLINHDKLLAIPAPMVPW